MTTNTTPAVEKRPPGRPSTGAALSSTERSRRRREALAAAGARTITVTLTAEAAAALERRIAAGEKQDQAVSAALLGR